MLFLLVEFADEEMGEKEALDAFWSLIGETNTEISWEIHIRRW